MKKITLYASLLVILDQILKFIVKINLSEFESIIVIKNIFNITYVKNFGAAFSILTGNTFFLILVGFVTLFITYIYFIKNSNLKKIDIIVYSLFIGGLVGNLIDRILYNYVIDYIDITIINYPIFNLADTFIVISVIILIILEMREYIWKLKSKKKVEE